MWHRQGSDVYTFRRVQKTYNIKRRKLPLLQIRPLKNVLSILLALCILLQSFSKVWIILSFKINQDYIAKTLCINRGKPEVNCCGKCVLVKNLKAEEAPEGKQVPQKSKEQKDNTYCFDLFQWLIDKPEELVSAQKQPGDHRCPCTNSYVSGVFRPPNAG